MADFDRYTFTHEDMAKLISVYYKEQERNVKTSFNSNEDGYTSIRLKETVIYNGETKTAEREMNQEKLNDIISTIFARAGRQVVDVINYAAAGSKVNDFGLIHTVKPEEEKRFVVVTNRMNKLNVR